jgi:hypothetical protein
MNANALFSQSHTHTQTPPLFFLFFFFPNRVHSFSQTLIVADLDRGFSSTSFGDGVILVLLSNFKHGASGRTKPYFSHSSLK